MEDVDDAWAVFSRTYIAHILDEEGRAELRAAPRAAHAPHALPAAALPAHPPAGLAPA